MNDRDKIKLSILIAGLILIFYGPRSMRGLDQRITALEQQVKDEK